MANQQKTLEYLGLGWNLSKFSGWGVLGIHLSLVLLKKGLAAPVPLFLPDRNGMNPSELASLEPAFGAWEELKAMFEANRGGEVRLEFPVLTAMEDRLDVLSYEAFRITGRPNLALVYFANTYFPEENIRRAERFSRIFPGSNWGAEILRSRGVKNVKPWFVGFDPEVFHPGPRPDRYPGRYVIYSGGKLEFRKGQDIVLEAFKRFHQRHPDAFLLNTWYNSWSFSLETLLRSPHIDSVPRYGSENRMETAAWLEGVGLDRDSFEALPALPHEQMADVYRSADIAVFPNRAEPATNQVAKECLACGLPVILSKNTGHIDLIDSVECLPLETQRPLDSLGPEDGVEGWGESDVDEVVELLEWGYQNRDEAKAKGLRAHEQMQDWTWEKQVERLFGEVRQAYGETD